MTLDEMRDLIWKGTGKLTQYDPDTDVSWNGGSFLTWVVNEAQRRIASWKDPVSGRRCRFHELWGDMNYKTTVITDTVSAVNNTTFPYYIDLTGTNVGTGDDRYNDWVVEFTDGDADGELRFITDYDSANTRIYISEVYGTSPAVGDAVELYKNFEFILPSTHDWVSEHISKPGSDRSTSRGNFLEILKVIDIEEERELTRGERAESFELYTTSCGDPSSWWIKGSKLLYDINVDSDKWLRLEYYRMPGDMSLDDDIPELPEQFHMAMVLWGKAYIFEETLESSTKYATEQTLVKFMRSTVSNYDAQDDRSHPGGSIRNDYDIRR